MSRRSFSRRSLANALVKIRFWLTALLEKIANHAAGFRVDGAAGSSSPAE
jgi:hypothetical protein